MNLIKLSWSNLRAKPLNTFLSLLLLTLGVALVSMLLILNKQLDEQFKRNISGIDMVVGAKGSPLQLILSSVYHIDNPTGNISLEEAESLLKNPIIQQAIPLAYGDSYKGYRIVGTNKDYPEHYGIALKEGKLWTKEYEVTAGAVVAKNLGLKIGDHFHSAHGLVENAPNHEDAEYKVVGIFDHNNSVIDQLLLTDITSVWAIHEHGDEHENENENVEGHDEEGVHEEHTHEHEHQHSNTEEGISKLIPGIETLEGKEITAMLVKFKNKMGVMTVPRMVNEKTSMQAAVPAIEVNRLFTLMGVGMDTLRAIAFFIIIVSGISVFVSLFNSLKERKYELALMRSMGASRTKLFLLVLLEGLILSLIGFVLGMLTSRLGLYFLSGLMQSNYHYGLEAGQFLPQEGVLFIATIGIGIVAALLPALQAFNMNISKTLANA
ncbi:MAG: ABC transporter permease [Chitinophagales bacterium]